MTAISKETYEQIQIHKNYGVTWEYQFAALTRIAMLIHKKISPKLTKEIAFAVSFLLFTMRVEV